MTRFIFFTFLLLGAGAASARQTYERTLRLMGSRFDITVVAEDSASASQYIDLAVGEIRRIEKIISSWDSTSETSAVNRQAGIAPVAVSAEMFGLVQRALGLSRLTDGAFDISFAAVEHLWKFDGSMQELPPPDTVAYTVAKVGYRDIVLDTVRRTVFLKRPGMRIGFGAIGKGYAADRARDLLVGRGVPAGIINASGDMSTWGRQPNGKPWTVAITNPLDKHKAYGTVPVTDGAVATSGNYEKYAFIGGKRYTHIIDPRTGYPCRGLASVTIFAPKAELADALATSVFVMGADAGLDRVNQLPGIECIIVDDEGRILKSDHIEIETP